ncbi:hypothetical protein [Candidatus Tisiphia endosymbiont of Nemotelus uliginosus]|uniref:hypothetical protein n=1 Tax=Candidatus Tisiphia endosymbiont of Nemotelus uliginosus TaxID=3077926 RepID=UPI0035C8ACE0
MSNYLKEVVFNIICNNSTNITNIKDSIESNDCNMTNILNSDFSFRSCEVASQPFISIVNSIKQYFWQCVPQILAQPQPEEYISHIQIFKNEAMGVTGIKYLVKSLCNFACDFAKKALEINREDAVSFLLTFVNNSIIKNISVFEDCPAAEIHSDLFPHGTEMHMVFIDNEKVKNDSCIISNNITGITNNLPSHLPLHQQAPTNIPVPAFVLGFLTLAVGMTSIAYLINKYIEKANANSSRSDTANHSIASDLNNIILFLPKANDQLAIIGEAEEGVV